jgi:rhomboid family GlyGly-CTERM serine protease
VSTWRPTGQLRSAAPFVAVGLLAVLLQLVVDPGLLRWERDSVGAEPWRLVSAHLVHLGWAHLALNLAGLALAWILFGAALSPLGWVVVMLACALGVATGLQAFSPEVMWYAGLSGVLHGLLVAGALLRLRAYPGVAGAVLVLLAVKIAGEQFGTGSEGVERFIGAPVITAAHLYGALAGLACGLLAWLPFRSASRGRSTPG